MYDVYDSYGRYVGPANNYGEASQYAREQSQYYGRDYYVEDRYTGQPVYQTPGYGYDGYHDYR